MSRFRGRQLTALLPETEPELAYFTKLLLAVAPMQQNTKPLVREQGRCRMRLDEAKLTKTYDGLNVWKAGNELTAHKCEKDGDLRTAGREPDSFC